MFRSGFINIIGKPNAGKSTLMNLLIGENLSVITPKAQTTRKRITGIINSKNYQIIFTDNPGIVDQPAYKLHEWMNRQIRIALADADVIVYLTTPDEIPDEKNELLETLKKAKTPVLVLINKIDLVKKENIDALTATWQDFLPDKKIIAVSALKKMNTQQLIKTFSELLPEHASYYPDDALTDRDERFFVSEIIRGKIMEQYREEIPYSAEVVIDDYKEKENINVIRAIIYVTKESHKNIIIGPKGEAIKKIGIASRKEIEELTGRKAFLELFVKVKENWKNDERTLKSFGYE